MSITQKKFIIFLRADSKKQQCNNFSEIMGWPGMADTKKEKDQKTDQNKHK